MKKRKILVLFPVLGLLLSGCTFQEALGNVKDWTNGHIIDPIKNLINGGEKEEQKDDEDDPTPTPSPSEVVLSSVEFKSGPKTVKVGESVDPSSVKLTATYSDASTKEVAAEKVTVDTSVAAENVEGIAEYQGKTAAFTINVIEAPDTEHAGTEEDPFSAEDAVAVANSLGEGQVTEESYYIKGVVEDLEEAFNPSYGNYSFRFVGGFVAWRLKFGPNYEKLAEGAVEAGDTVTVYAQIQLFGNSKTPETKGGYITKIEKPAIDAKLVEVTLEGNPQTTYLAGAAYNHDGLSAIAHYDNGETQDVSLAADWEISKETAELGDETITISVTYLEFGASMAITVTVQDSSNPVHAGTAEDPYDGYDAVIVASKLASGAATEESYYIKGEVISFEETFNPTYGNYSFKIEGGFIGWRLKNGPEFELFTEGALQIGDTVTMYAQIQAYGNDCKPETKGGYIVSIEKPVIEGEIVSISIEGEPQTAYIEGAEYNHSGLTVIAHYDNGETQDITYAATWEISKETAAVGDESITITALYEDFSDELNVNVNVSAAQSPDHAGTAEDPYTIKDCEIVYANANLEQGKDIGKEVHVAGTILAEPEAKIATGRAQFYIGDSSSENPFYIHNANNVGGANDLTLDDIPAGSAVVVKGTLKNYNGAMQMCYVKNVANCEFISIDKPVVAVSSVSLDKNELNMEVGMPDETLVATVEPANATNKNVLWESSDSEVATVADGLVHAVAAGDAVITVKSAADASKTASCTVHVTQPQKQLVSIEVTKLPKVEYTEGDLLDLTGMEVTLHYDDQSTVVITSGWTTNIAADHPLTSEDTSLVVSYGGFSADAISLSIAEKQAIIQPGSYWIKQGDYYLSSDAGAKGQPLVTTDSSKAVIFDFVLEEGSSNEYKIKEHGGDNYLYVINDNNGVRIGSTEAVWTIEEGLAEKTGSYLFSAKDSADNTRYLTVYNNADFRCYKDSSTNRDANTDVEAPVISTLESIVVTSNPEKTSYLVGETFDPTGLVVTGHYELSDSTTKDVVLTADQYQLSFSGVFAAGDVGEKEITVSFGGKEASFVVEVSQPAATLTSISIEGNAKAEYTEGDPYSYEGLTATAHYSDETTMDITNAAEWAVSKATAEYGDQSVTITASFGGKTGELVVNVNVSEASTQKVYAKATSIAEGDSIAIVAEGAGKYLTSISSTSTKYGLASDVPETFTESAYELTVVAGSAEGTFAFKTSDDKYLCWLSGNSLNVSDTLNANSSWDISFDDNGNASIVNHGDSTRQIWWNVGSPRFACYTSKTDGDSYKITQIYKLA